MRQPLPIMMRIATALIQWVARTKRECTLIRRAWPISLRGIFDNPREINFVVSNLIQAPTRVKDETSRTLDCDGRRS
jgi:hypothetical protein